MRRVITLAVVLFLNLILQSTVLQHIAIIGVVPNTALIIILSMALLRGSTEGAAVGLFAGLLQDFFFGSSIGYYAFLGMATGYIAGKFNKGFYRENYLMPMLLTFLATFCYESSIFLTSVLFRGHLNYLYFLSHIILPEMVYNTVCTIVIYRILFSVNSATEEKEKFKRRLFSIK